MPIISMNPKCKVVDASHIYGEVAIRHVEIGRDKEGQKYINVYIQGKKFVYACIRFTHVIGIRMLDEIDLCEFWNDYNLGNGWMYEVIEGGWLDLERTRDRFVSDSVWNERLHEYFLVEDMCLNVMSLSEPIIEDLGGDPRSQD